MEMSGQAHILAALPQGKSPEYPLNRRLCRPHSRSGTWNLDYKDHSL